MDWTPIWVAAGVVGNWLVFYFWQPWAKAYAEESAKQRAREDNLERILAEVRAVTITQKTIESRLSGDLWERQMHATQKRDVYAALLKAVYSYRDALIKLMLIDHQTPQQKVGGLKTVQVAYDDILSQTMLAYLYANERTMSAIGEFLKTAPGYHDLSVTNELEKLIVKTQDLLASLIVAAKVDLGIIKSPVGRT